MRARRNQHVTLAFLSLRPTTRWSVAGKLEGGRLLPDFLPGGTDAQGVGREVYVILARMTSKSQPVCRGTALDGAL